MVNTSRERLSQSDENEFDKLFDLLKRGDKEINLSDRYKDVVLVLGNTGAGKTTFTQWITGNDDKLIAREVIEGSGEYIIEDNNRIGNSTIESTTIFPELVVHNKTNTAFYDCPGFDDTRSTANDIATTYFIKEVIDHSDRIKIMFVINYPSVRKGVDRQDFMKLMKHATDLLKDIDKFASGMGIAVTKVDNTIIRQHGNYVLVSDDVIIKGIANFFREVKQNLEEEAKNSDISGADRQFYYNSIKFIEILLGNSENAYPNIGIFRRPNEAGPLSAIELLQDGKARINDTIYERLNYTVKHGQDFGYTISEKSQNDVYRLAGDTNRNISDGVNRVADWLSDFYRVLVKRVSVKIESFVTSHTNVGADESEAKELFSRLADGYNVTKDLVEELQTMTNPEELLVKLNSSMTSLGLMTADGVSGSMNEVADQVKYLSFLKIVSSKELRAGPWGAYFKEALLRLSDSKTNIRRDAEDVSDKIKNYLNGTIDAIHGHYNEKMRSFDIQELPAELKNEREIFFEIGDKIRNAQTDIDSMNIIIGLNDATNKLGINIPENATPIIVNKKKYLNYLEAISDERLDTGTLSRINPIDYAIKLLDRSEKWYTFVNDLYYKFSDYQIQADIAKYNVKDLGDWGKSGKPHGLEINSNNIQQFLKIIEEYNVAESENIKNMTFSDSQLDELNHVLRLTLKSKINAVCRESSLFITGNHIKIQDVLSILDKIHDKSLTLSDYIIFDNGCKIGNIKYANVYALDTLFIDKNYKFSELIPLIVIAPTWNIIGSREVDLNGFTPGGKSKPAADGKRQGDKGKDGDPGLPGGPGGTLIGIGETFVKGRQLAITANGGKGGNGQDGGSGCKGAQGKTPEAVDVSCSADMCDCVEYSHPSIFHEIVPSSIVHCNYKLFGEPGTAGGDGGSGGANGLGGSPGVVTLFELGGKSEIVVDTKYGSDGKNGIGGRGGEGGRSGDGKTVYLEYTLPRYPHDHMYSVDIHNNTIASSGKKGKDGGNNKNRPDRIQPTIVEEPAKYVNEYKSYLRENLNDRFMKKNLFNFLTLLDNNKKVKQVYNTLGLVDDLQGIEGQYHVLKTDVDFLPFYQSLLNRISEYAQHPHSSEIRNDYKKVLNYLYTATLSRIYKVKDHPEPNLVMNVYDYVKSVKEDMDNLKDMRTIKNKSDLIEKYKAEYNNGIAATITEAKELITTFIRPELDNIGSDIDNKIDSLINEVLEKEKEAEEEEKMLIEAKEKLEEALDFKALLGPLGIIGQLLGVMGPLGEIGSSIIETGTTISGFFALDGTASGQSTLKVPGGVTYLDSLIKECGDIGDKIVAPFDKVLDDISQDLKNRSEKIGYLSSTIGNIKKKLNADSGKLTFSEVRNLQDEFEQELKSAQQKLIDPQNNKGNQESRYILLNRVRRGEYKITEKFTDLSSGMGLGSLINNRKTPTYLERVHDLKKESKIKVNKKNEMLIKTEKKPGNDTEDAIAAIKKYIKRTNVLVNCGLDIYNKYKENDSAMDQIDMEIEKAKDKYRKLHEYEGYIYTLINPTLQKVKSDMEDIRSKLGTKSKVALDVTKWQVRSALEDTKLQMKQLTDGFQVQDNLARCIEKMEEAMTTLINIYDHVQDYQEHQRFASYIADISSASADNIVVSDPKLNDALNYLDITINSNIVLQRYQTAIAALKQFVFPFAHLYLRELTLPPYLELGNSRSKIDLENQVQEVGKQIEIVRKALETYKLSITGQDNVISEGEFSSGYISTQPFYVWKYEDDYAALSKLLSGDEVVMKADIMNSPSDKDSIKFNVIKFEFKSKNETLQKEIENRLKGFQVKATHLGNSYYRYKDKIYLIKTTSEPIWYSYEKKHNSDDPVKIGGAYAKLKNGDLMLSPYTLWKIVLTNLTSDASFEHLEIYKDGIHLELSGSGNYIERDVDEPDLMVEKYYTEAGTYVEPYQSETTGNKLESNYKFESAENQINQDSTQRVNRNNLHSSKWFTWINFPNFNILPGAEANVIEVECLKKREEPTASIFHKITLPFMNGINLLKNVITTKISNLIDDSEVIYNGYEDYVMIGDYPKSLNNMAIGFERHSNNDIQSTISADLHGNIILGQLIANKVFGTDTGLLKPFYVSPDLEQINRIRNLESEVLPIINNNPYNNCTYDNDFIISYNRSPNWYQDMNKNVHEEILSKRNSRNMKKLANDLTEEIFSDVSAMFSDVLSL